MSDGMTFFVIVYVGLIVLLFLSSISARDFAVTNSDRKYWARMAIASPVWPLILLWGLYVFFRDLIRDAR